MNLEFIDEETAAPTKELDDITRNGRYSRCGSASASAGCFCGSSPLTSCSGIEGSEKPGFAWTAADWFVAIVF
jgi:hypothetical protein